MILRLNLKLKYLNEIGKEDEKMKDKIIMWDDINFWLSKPDNIENIIEDIINLFNKYVSLKKENPITSVFSVFHNRYLDISFHIQFIELIDRIGRLENG